MRHIYLDYNATTPVAPSVKEAMLPFLGEYYGNPSSDHAQGRACQEAIEDARGEVAELLGCDREEVVFTSCGTEANNLALKGVLLRRDVAQRGHLVISALEHPAIVEPAKFLKRMGFGLTIVGCDPQGVVDPDVVAAAIREDTVLVSIMHANNEIGTVQPIRKIARICREHHILIHTDAAQTVGKIRTNVDELDVDLLSFSAHKFYGPKGIGALYVRQGTAVEPLLHGAGHESGMRAGTENVPYIVGLGKAASLVRQSLDKSVVRLMSLRDRLHDALTEAIGVRLSVNGLDAERLPNTLSMNFPDVMARDMLSRIPELCASTGAACHSGVTNVSATLAAIGVPSEVARGTVRLSVGWSTSEEEVDRAVNLLAGAWEAVKG
jgi:cysteine desulfurase